MTVFAYKGWDKLGRKTRGTLVASSGAEARSMLRDRGLRIRRFAPARQLQAVPLSTPRVFVSRSRRREKVAEFARLMALMIRSGVTLSEALEVLVGQSKGRWQVVLREVHEQLDSGTSFAESLRRHGEWFDDLFVETVRVGEHAGALDESLSHLAEFLKEHESLAARLKTAAVYPCILMVVAAGVVLFLMSYVVPQLLTVLSASGQTLPVSTRVLKTSSDALLNGWPLILSITITGTVAMVLLLRTPSGKRAWHRTLLRLPLLGTLVRKTLVARFAQQMGVMLAAGVPFVEALAIVRKTAGHAVLVDELQQVEQAVVAGSDIAPALRDSRVFPPLVAHLIAVGQRSGELPVVLNQLRVGYEAEVRVAVTRFTTALEPILIIAMAAVVGFIVLATLLPILQVTRTLV